ncbi:lipid-binding SYLF domain-containing protein [Luteimonas sp. MC1750]|uniref:lipid-binding SYLF domain-containing protein n=1 Tax=Luteimonas sp. MC1750 TaxID=2799326 RepID=UPI0018F098A3|nr:lipid-binding SYLF domain-containing protein [Luteimonas sp. MC1750]MBJ6985176.1 lipid-binding SYLF domain-containing protein [Luteimonas sp. MC1750]QQO07352.1 lipid-binding SYLF domain-containing protein [Luteimonas sp. MC1750]
MLRLPVLATALSLALAAAPAAAGPREDARAVNAVRVLTDIQAIPESAIPEKLFDEARAIVVVPDTIKAGLVIGGRRGHGMMSVKNPDGTWSNPSFVKLTGGSIGLQAGVQSADVVLVFRSDRGLESIVNGKFTLGADAAVAAGPVGRNASTATDGELKAEIWSWSRARGLFAGIALDGAVLSIDDAANEAAYGRDTTPRMIFEGRANGQPSTPVVEFRDSLEEATALARANRGTEGTAARARTRVAATPAPAPAQGATVETSPIGTGTTPAQGPGAFEPVDGTQVTSEPLPADNLPAPLPDPID